MRISGGDARGVRLKTVPGSRPTSERVRQAIFSSLGEHVLQARVLDLWCGSGAYGLEAVSRGATSAVFVDRDPKAIGAARQNAVACGAAHAVFHRRDALRYAQDSSPREGPFDLVFCDPPYEAAPDLGELLAALGPALGAGARVVVEIRARGDPPPKISGYVLEADRRYGDTRVLVFRRSAGQSPLEEP